MRGNMLNTSSTHLLVRSAHMTQVVAKQTGPTICMTRKAVDVADAPPPPANPTTVSTTPTAVTSSLPQ